MRAMLVSSRTRLAMRFGVPVLVLTACLLALRGQVSGDVILSLPDQLSSISALQWALAATMMAASFVAVAQYDLLAHRALQTGISAQRARLSGAVGIALGQTLGFGLVTGALARWRLLPDMRFGQALRLSAFVSVTFVASWAVVAAVTCLVLPAPSWTFAPAIAGFALIPIAAALLFLAPGFRVAGHQFTLPSLALTATIVAYALLDTLLAAGTLFVLLPAGSVQFSSFFPLFLIAMGSGLISNTPGGVGPFELVLLTTLPFSDPAPLLAAILGYRLVYYALPAGIAALTLLRPLAMDTPATSNPVTKYADAPRSEVGVVHQNGGFVHRVGQSGLAIWPTGQTITLFADPVCGSNGSALRELTALAQRSGRMPMIYKCGARLAASARTCGWRVLHIADDAIVDLAGFTLDVPARRTLRRKLRTSEKAGLVVRCGPPLPDAAMTRVDVAWQQDHGRARGGSMGRYCPEYVQDQWVGCAYVKGRLIAFATAHKGRSEWCLDIMRHTHEAPDGTMHALVHAGLLAAQQAGATRFSLAATPACPDPSHAAWRWAAVQIVSRAKGGGLRQFKSSFAPRWVPRYAAARTWLAMAVALADIAQAIHRPGPVTIRNTNVPHDRDENYEVPSTRVA